MRMKNPKYNEGAKARKSFESAMTTLFRISKSVVAKMIKAKKKKGKD
jgi:hypothetical protein